MLISVVKKFKAMAALYIGAGNVQILAASLSVVYFQRLLDAIPLAKAPANVLGLLGGYAVFSLLNYALDYFDEYPMRILSNGIYHELKLKAAAKVSRMDYLAYQNIGTGKLVQLVENGADAGKKILFDFYLQLARELIPGLAIGLIFIGAYNLQIMLYLGIGYILVTVISGLLLRYLYSLKSGIIKDQEDLSRFSVRSFMEMVVFRVNKRFVRELNRIACHSERIVRNQAKIRMVHELFFVLFALIVLAIKVAIIWAGVGKIVAGTATIGWIVALTAFADRIFSPIAIFNVRYVDFKLDSLSFRRFQEFMNLPEDGNLTQGKDYVPGNGTLIFNAVSFGYESPILKRISLDIKGGSTVALVGTSGGGKSTAVKLILGLLKPSQGSISVDGQDLSSLSLNSYYDHISYVSQEAPVFDGSLRENIIFDKSVPDQEILEVLQRLNLTELLSRLPRGLDTPVGERGTKLSGGERQRLALARVLFQDSTLVILDEPTSALDGITEEQVTTAILDMLKGRTVIFIAHRLKAAAEADEILVLEQGELAEKGNFQELLERRGIFWALWQKQVLETAV